MASSLEKIAKYVDAERLTSAMESHIEKVGMKKALADIKPLLKSMKDSFKENINLPAESQAEFKEKLAKFGITKPEDSVQIIKSVKETLLARKLEDLTLFVDTALDKMNKRAEKCSGEELGAVKKVKNVIQMMKFNRNSYLTNKADVGPDIKLGDTMDDRIKTFERQVNQLLILGNMPAKDSLPGLQNFLLTELVTAERRNTILMKEAPKMADHIDPVAASPSEKKPTIEEDYRDPVFHDEPIVAPAFHEEPASPSDDLDGLDTVVDAHAAHYSEPMKADAGRVMSALSNKNDVGLEANQTKQEEVTQDNRSSIRLKH